jgi:hypothetical protein
MSFTNLSYQPGVRVMAVVPCHSTSGELPSCEGGNTGPSGMWQNLSVFKLIEGRLNFVQVSRTGEYAGSLVELGLNIRLEGGGEYAGYWNADEVVIGGTLRRLMANPNLSPDAKAFIMKYSMPRPIISEGYDELLRDISAAAGLQRTEAASITSIRAEAQRLGIMVMTDAERAFNDTPAGLLQAGAERLDELMEGLLNGTIEHNAQSPAYRRGYGEARPAPTSVDIARYQLNPFDSVAFANPSATEGDPDYEDGDI